MTKRKQQLQNQFLQNHPEINVVTNSSGNIEHIDFPENARRTSYTVFCDEILQLHYEIDGITYRFS